MTATPASTDPGGTEGTTQKVTARAPEWSPEDAALVVGLGNPGSSYAGNRHNVGFQAVDLLAERMAGRFKAHKARAHVLEGRLAGRRTVLAKPFTYMNLSGAPVAGLHRYYGVPAEHIVVVHDELDLPFGAVRLKFGGGDNGHNGLRSITTALGTRDYLRVRFGIGRPPGRQDPADYVLHDFRSADRANVAVLVDRAADAVESLLAHGLEPSQNVFHAL
ncbi:MAG: aminoacyl-tRNA hydrolase [Geodermatophilaceae bacterium]